jgi:arylamine N-acetyltransferase
VTPDHGDRAGDVIDLDAYFARIGFDGPRPTLTTLNAVRAR